MNERLVEDWLTKASERSFQTPFAQALLADGFQVLRLGHGPHEHGKDIIAADAKGEMHAFQLKSGDLGLKGFEAGLPQLNALVETPVEHPRASSRAKHHSHLVLSGELSMPALDRLRLHNTNWKRRGFRPLQVLNGAALTEKFLRMSANFWPQQPLNSRNLLSLYLAQPKSNLDRDVFAKAIADVIKIGSKAPKTEVVRSLAAANLFTSYALAPYHTTENYWELLQGWTITAAHIAHAAEQAKLPRGLWTPTFRLAVDAGFDSLTALAEDALAPNALRPPASFELDDLTRSRCTICVGAVATKILIERERLAAWPQESAGKALIEQLIRDQRTLLWGESAVPLYAAIIWALDRLRPDAFSDLILLRVLRAIATVNTRRYSPHLASPYESADDANAKVFRRLFEPATESYLQDHASRTAEALVALAARRLWRNALAAMWSDLSKMDLVRLVPDKPRDIYLWRWGHKRGSEQSRRYESPQSWAALLAAARKCERQSLPSALKEHFDFAMLFFLTYPHRFSVPIVKHLDSTVREM
jgi:hypothetical protein